MATASWIVKQEALLLQRDRAMRYISKFVLCLTRYGSSFTNFKDMIRTKFKNKNKKVTWIWPRLLGSSLPSKAKQLIYSTCIQTLSTVEGRISAFQEEIKITHGQSQTLKYWSSNRFSWCKSNHYVQPYRESDCTDAKSRIAQEYFSITSKSLL